MARANFCHLIRWQLLFPRLNATTVANKEIANEVNEICNTVVGIMKSVEAYSMKDRINSMGYLVKTELVEMAMKTIHLMQKFYRYAHNNQVAFTFAPLKQLCATTKQLASFVNQTAQISGSITRTGQARKMIDLTENRLVALKVCLPWYRTLVQRYAFVRSGLWGDLGSCGTAPAELVPLASCGRRGGPIEAGYALRALNVHVDVLREPSSQVSRAEEGDRENS